MWGETKLIADALVAQCALGAGAIVFVSVFSVSTLAPWLICWLDHHVLQAQRHAPMPIKISHTMLLSVAAILTATTISSNEVEVRLLYERKYVQWGCVNNGGPISAMTPLVGQPRNGTCWKKSRIVVHSDHLL